MFQSEAQRITAYVNENTEQASIEKRREVRLAVQMNDCQFDVQTVTDYYLQQQKNESAVSQDPNDNFQFFIRMNSRARCEEQYRTLFVDLIDSEKVKQAEL